MARAPQGDDEPWLAEGVREERSTLVPRARLFGGTLIAVLLAVLVGLGVYLASGHKSDGSTGYARPEDAPLIAADAGPYKLAPTDPGGAKITGIDDSIAAAASGNDQGSAIAADTPEEPLARPGPSTPVAPPTDLLPATIPPAAPTRPIADTPVVAPPPGRTAAAASPAVPAKPSPALRASPPPARPDTTAAAKPATVKPAATPPDPLAPPAELAARAAKFDPDAPKAATDDTKAKPDTPKAAKTPAGGSVTLQLGAFSTRDKADAAWARAGADSALAGLAERIEPVERDGAILYRLRAGGVASKGAAAALCARVKARGVACVVAE